MTTKTLERIAGYAAVAGLGLFAIKKALDFKEDMEVLDELEDDDEELEDKDISKEFDEGPDVIDISKTKTYKVETGTEEDTPDHTWVTLDNVPTERSMKVYLDERLEEEIKKIKAKPVEIPSYNTLKKVDAIDGQIDSINMLINDIYDKFCHMFNTGMPTKNILNLEGFCSGVSEFGETDPGVYSITSTFQIQKGDKYDAKKIKFCFDAASSKEFDETVAQFISGAKMLINGMIIGVEGNYILVKVDKYAMSGDQIKK